MVDHSPAASEPIEEPVLLSPAAGAELATPAGPSVAERPAGMSDPVAGERGMYMAASATLGPMDFLRRSANETVFPFTAPDGIYFFAARSGIYHLMRALGRDEVVTVLMPDYHSGAEVWAVKAAGASVRYYHIRRDLTPDLDEVRDLCRSGCRVLYLIHYFGWSQPVREMRELCRELGMILIEDCALSLLSEHDGQPLGTFGDYAVFCLYKTLPVPNGGMLIQTATPFVDGRLLELKADDRLSTLARISELIFLRMRSRSDICGRTMLSAKTAIGRLLTSFGITRLPVGDITPDFQSEGYEIKNLTGGMSPISKSLLKRFDYKAIYRRRRQNYLCPLFFPLMVSDKHTAANAFRERGIEATEFWNFGHPDARTETAPDAQFLRDHLLELPIHQDVTDAQVDYLADQVLKLRLLL